MRCTGFSTFWRRIPPCEEAPGPEGWARPRLMEGPWIPANQMQERNAACVAGRVTVHGTRRAGAQTAPGAEGVSRALPTVTHTHGQQMTPAEWRSRPNAVLVLQ